MYVPKHFAITSKTQLHDLIQDQGFGVLVSEGLEANHLPFVLRRDEGEYGTLYGHFARANPQWKTAAEQEVLVIFSGPHAYISPTWDEHSPAVPTWNFISVHAKGYLTMLFADETAEALHDALTTFEPGLLTTRDVVTPDIQEKLSPAIVGFKIEIDSLQGKAKLSQNLPEPMQAKVQAALVNSNRSDALALAEVMAKHQNANLTKASK